MTGTQSGSRLQTRWTPRFFPLPEARRALGYVSRVVADINDAYWRVQYCRLRLRAHRTDDCAMSLEIDRDEALKRLDAATDECHAVGVDLRDLVRGEVSFLSEINGRACCLLWRLGDPVDNAWQQLEQMSALPSDRFPDRALACSIP